MALKHKAQVGLYLPFALVEILDSIAAESGESRSSVARRLLAEKLRESYPQAVRPITKAEDENTN